jgi:hypothetical protein
VSGGQSELPRLLTAAETAAPVEAVDVVAEDLRRRLEATKVSFLIVDLTGKAVARLSSTDAAEGGREAERIPLPGSVYEQVIRTQRLYQEETGRGQRVIVPVTNRGDAIGLLELLLPVAPGEDVLAAVGEAAHVLAYIVIANGRFTGRGRSRILLTNEQDSRSVAFGQLVDHEEVVLWNILQVRPGDEQ